MPREAPAKNAIWSLLERNPDMKADDIVRLARSEFGVAVAKKTAEDYKSKFKRRNGSQRLANVEPAQEVATKKPPQIRVDVLKKLSAFAKENGNVQKLVQDMPHITNMVNMVSEVGGLENFKEILDAIS